MEERVFSPAHIAMAVTWAAAIELGFFFLLILAGQNRAFVEKAEERTRLEVPIQVKPVLDDTALLKLGGKKKMRAKLPDMWKKNPPVQRFEAKSAPSPKAEKTPEAIPTTPVAEGDAQAPPPDAEVAKVVDEVLLDAGPDAEPTVEGEGTPDGVKEGTETDPLKGRAVSLYKMKIAAWFNARFTQPDIECEELKGLNAGVVANVGGERTVTGYSMTRPSGNPVFDAKVQSTMAAIVGQQLPPPPPLYPDLLSAAESVTFRGKCP